MRSARSRATSYISSRRMTGNAVAVKPCLRPFCAQRALPSAVRGPVERSAFARLAASCFSDIGFLNGMAFRVCIDGYLSGSAIALREAGLRIENREMTERKGNIDLSLL